MATMNKGNNALKTSGVITDSAVTVLVLNVDFIIEAIDDRLFSLYRKLLPWVIHREFKFGSESFE